MIFNKANIIQQYNCQVLNFNIDFLIFQCDIAFINEQGGFFWQYLYERILLALKALNSILFVCIFFSIFLNMFFLRTERHLHQIILGFL